MGKKSFFREREIAKIKSLKRNRAYNQRNLIDIISGLDPNEEALEIRTMIIPGRFYRNAKDNREVSRKCLKHGDLIALTHPKTKTECRNCPEIPLQIRSRDFSLLQKMKEQDINFVGYSVQSSWGDRIKRVFPFVFIPEGIRIFTYSENDTRGIEIEIYQDARKVATEGASVVVEIPSRTEKEKRYKFRLVNVPILRNAENLATVLTLRPAVLQDEETGEPLKSRTLHETYNIRYTSEEDIEKSNVINFYPHDIAAYMKIAGSEWKAHNLTPMTFNPFALPSKQAAKFYVKLGNNVLIYDSTLKRKDKLRKLHLAEKSILLARAIGKFGHNDFAFWDPERDGKLRDYDWSISENKKAEN
ncbi:hypothetical protein HYV50_00445 [Candidatus Pacearchaeota archaeon]|nr:hypothetical protein [Candidatus Pacearchaeota archaeon]